MSFEHRVHLEVNNVLNNDFDSTKPLRNKKAAEQLKEYQDILSGLGSLRIKAISQYNSLSEQEKIATWKNYSPKESTQNEVNTSLNELAIRVKLKFETFETLSLLLKDKVAEDIKSILFADLFKLLTFESVYSLLSKIRAHLEAGKRLEFLIAEDYLASMVPSNPEGTFAKQTPDSYQKVTEFSGTNFSELKQHYVKERSKHGKRTQTEGNLLQKIVVTIPQTQDMEVIMGLTKDNQVVYSVSPSYRALFHELTHAHRGFKGSHKRKYALPEHLGLFFSKNAEELWTILLGKTSEKTLSKDDHLPMRLGHSSFTLYIDQDKVVASPKTEEMDRAEMKILHRKIQAEILTGQRDFTSIDFNGQSNSGKDRLEVDLSRQQGIFKFDQANLTLFAFDAKISKSSFYLANLSYSRFNKATADRADFSGGIFKEFRAQHSNFDASNFEKAVVDTTSLSGNSFNGARFKQSSIMYSTISKCTFLGANLSNARITNTTFENVDFSGVNLDNAVFSNVTFKNCNFSNMVAKNMKIVDCKLENVSFKYADMNDCEIEGEFTALDTTEANTKNCTFTNTSMGLTPHR